MQRWFLWAARGAGLLLGLGFLGGYAGALHPLGDSLAVFRLWFAGALAVLAAFALLARGGRLALISTLAAAVASAPILWAMWLPPWVSETTDVTVYVKNLGNARADIRAFLSDVSDTDPDILLLQEVTRENAAFLQARLAGYPHWHLCQFSGWSGMAVVSRWPISDTACTSQRSVATAEVQAPDGVIWVASVHQVWPYPYDQAVLLPMVLGVMRADAARRIVAGDFNMVPWGHSVRRIAEVSDTRRIGQLRTTIDIRGMRLPIDHVLTNGMGWVSLRPGFGSDHAGLLARVAFPGVE